MGKGKRVIAKERDYLKEMLDAEFYNEKRIPGYNHLTGWLDFRNAKSPTQAKVYTLNSGVLPG